MPDGPSGLYESPSGSASNRTSVPFAVQSEEAAPILVVLPFITWFGSDGLDDDRDGVPNTLGRGARRLPEADAAGPPRALHGGHGALLAFLDRQDVPTTSRRTSRWSPAAPASRRAARACCSPARCAGCRTSRRRLRRYAGGGGRVASFGTDALRRGVDVARDRLLRPLPPAPEDAFGAQISEARTLGSPEPLEPVADEGGTGLPPASRRCPASRSWRSRSGRQRVRAALAAVDEHALEEAEERGEEPPETRPALALSALGDGAVIRVGLPEWGAKLQARSVPVQQLTRNISDMLRGIEARCGVSRDDAHGDGGDGRRRPGGRPRHRDHHRRGARRRRAARARPRHARVAMLAALALTPVLLISQIWDTPQLDVVRDRPPLALGGGLVAAIAVVVPLAVLFHRRPAILPLRRSPRCRSASRSRPGADREPARPAVPRDRRRRARVGGGARARARRVRPPRATARSSGCSRASSCCTRCSRPTRASTWRWSRPSSSTSRSRCCSSLLREVEWSPRRLRAGLLVLVALALVFVAVGFVEYATRSLLLNPKVIASNELEEYFRVNSLFFDPNIYGRFLSLVMLGLAAVLLWERRPRDVRSPRSCSRSSGAGWCSRSRSRASPGCSRACSCSPRCASRCGASPPRRSRWSILGLVVVLAFPSALRLDLGDAESLDDATSGRYELVRGGIDLARDRPLTGWGSGAFAKAYLEEGFGLRRDAVSASHTIPLTVTAEQGIIGLAPVHRTARRGARPAPLRRTRRPYRAFVAAGFIAVVVHTWMYASFLEDPVTWALLAVGTSLAATRPTTMHAIPLLPSRRHPPDRRQLARPREARALRDDARGHVVPGAAGCRASSTRPPAPPSRAGARSRGRSTPPPRAGAGDPVADLPVPRPRSTSMRPIVPMNASCSSAIASEGRRRRRRPRGRWQVGARVLAVYGDGTRVQRGISGSWHAATIAGTSRSSSARSPITRR